MVSKKFHFQSLLIGLLLVLTILPAGNAKADVGIPPAHPGYSLSPGDYDTNVQMVSEEVVIIIHKDPYNASVGATFQMRNNSAEDEEIEELIDKLVDLDSFRISIKPLGRYHAELSRDQKT